MSRRQVTSLGDVRDEDEIYLLVTCHCRREAAFEVEDVRRYFHARRWSDAFRGLERRFRCAPGSPWGCGRTARRVALCFKPPALPYDRMPPPPPWPGR